MYKCEYGNADTRMIKCLDLAWGDGTRKAQYSVVPYWGTSWKGAVGKMIGGPRAQGAEACGGALHWTLGSGSLNLERQGTMTLCSGVSLLFCGGKAEQRTMKRVDPSCLACDCCEVITN